MTKLGDMTSMRPGFVVQKPHNMVFCFKIKINGLNAHLHKVLSI